MDAHAYVIELHAAQYSGDSRDVFVCWTREGFKEIAKYSTAEGEVGPT